jgi:hypothetical protein
MRYLGPCIAVCLTCAAPSGAAAEGTCPPEGWDRARLTALKAADFEIPEPALRRSFARSVIACVAAPDPFLRDGIAFEALSHMLRADQLDTETKVAIARDLLSRLGSHDAAGFEAPFAALLLADVVRADGVQRYLPDALRADIADAAASYVTAVRDYRGFDEREGWRHGVAHGADLLMRLAHNTHLDDRARLERLRDAVAAQVAPLGHFYIYGEPERLMQPVVMLARRGLFTEADWTAWFARLAEPTPFASWDEAFRSQTGLARRHDLRAFLYAVWLNARINQDGTDDVLLPGAEAALRALP